MTSKFTTQSWGLLLSVHSTDMPNGFSFRPVKITDVKLVINNLPNSESAGDDSITSRMIKISSASTDALVCIFNSSLLCGIFPSYKKQAIAIPIHKKSDIFDMANYRPISLLPTFSKLLDKLVNAQVSDYLESKAMLNTAQRGF